EMIASATSQFENPRVARRRIWLGGAALAALLGAAGIGVAHRSARSSGFVEQNHGGSVPSMTAETEVSPNSFSSSSSSQSPNSSSSFSSASLPSSGSAATLAKNGPKPSSTRGWVRPPKKKCDPPYQIDDAGVRRYKADCI